MKNDLNNGYYYKGKHSLAFRKIIYIILWGAYKMLEQKGKPHGASLAAVQLFWGLFCSKQQ